MNRRPARPAGRALILVAGLGLLGCEAPKAHESAKPASPSKVEKAVKESDLTTIKLTPEAEAHLGLVTVPAAVKKVGRTRVIAGDLIVPAGRLITVSAPFSGTLVAPEGKPVPAAGMPVRRGQPVFILKPMVSPDRFILTPVERIRFESDRADAEAQVKNLKIQRDQARIALDRAEQLVRDRVGSPGALIDARNAFSLAETQLANAEARKKVFDKARQSLEGGDGEIEPLVLEAQADGVLRNFQAQVGQKVAVGAPLFEVESLDPLWVKVPVYVGDLAAIDTDQPAQITGLTDTRGYRTKPARPIPAPPSADPLAVTADLYYEVANGDGTLRPGQKVGVILPLQGEQEGLVVPKAAVLRDISGGEWVYERLASRTYARRRVLVDRVVGDLALLERHAGPRPGAEVVTDGAAELFGTEFGGSK